MSDFQQTVNLKDSLKPRPAPKPAPEPKPQARPAPAVPKRKAEEIDQVYRDEAAPQANLRTIERARPGLDMEALYRRAAIVLFLLLAASLAYFGWFRRPAPGPAVGQPGLEQRWYSIKLANNEVYYGQVADTAADPIVIKNVYYNYDQLNPAAPGQSQPADAASLRLVKRGKETYGPDGSMSIVRAQVVYLEPLKDDSKVLKAILDYERQ